MAWREGAGSGGNTGWFNPHVVVFRAAARLVSFLIPVPYLHYLASWTLQGLALLWHKPEIRPGIKPGNSDWARLKPLPGRTAANSLVTIRLRMNVPTPGSHMFSRKLSLIPLAPYLHAGMQKNVG